MTHLNLDLLDEIANAVARGEREWPADWTRERPRFDAFTMTGPDEDNDMPRGMNTGVTTAARKLEMATDAQKSYIMRLDPDATNLDKLTKRDASKLIERLKLDRVPMATEGQLAFINKLISERVIADGHITTTVLEQIKMARLPMSDASRVIDILKACPMKPVDAPASTSEFDTICAELVKMGNRYGARFAVVNNDGAVNTISFWNVTKWNNRYYVKQIIGGSEDGHVTKLNADARLAVVRKIAIDPKAAMTRYGIELARCGHCNKTLTDDASRAAGIGPVCARKHGW